MNKTVAIFIEILVFIFIVHSSIEAQNIYVAINGNDSATGQIDKPLQTPEGARLRIRELKATGLKGPITVFFRNGDYHIKKTLAFTIPDTGTPESPILYQAYPGEKVRFIGGEKLTFKDFEPIESQSLKKRIISIEARDKVLQVNLKAKCLSDYGQIYRRGYYMDKYFPMQPAMELFIDGVPMTLSRWPNNTDVSMNEILDPGPLLIPATYPLIGNSIYAEKNPAYAKLISHLTGGIMKGKIFGPTMDWGSEAPDFLKRGGKFSYTYDRPALWKTEGSEIWITGIFGFSWEGSYNKVDSIDKKAKTVRLRYGEVSGIIKQWYPDAHHYENIFEEIDMPGEYYIDRINGVLYFYPPINFNDSTEIALSTLSTPMININGASYLNFKDIVLACGRSDAIVQTDGNSNRFVNIEVAAFAGNGIIIRKGNDNGVVSCYIHHVGHKGVLIGGGDFKTLTPCNSFIEFSTIHNNAYYNKTFNAAIGTDSGSVGVRISNNLVHNTPHLGVSVIGNDHLVEKNEIHHTAMEYSDMGAIYMGMGERPGERGHVFRYNYLHHIGLDVHGIKAIYCDNQVQGITVEGNIFYRIKGSGTHSNSGAYISVRNNIYIDCETPYSYSYHSFTAHDFTNVWTTYFDKYKFMQMPHGTKYPELLLFMSQGVEGRKNTPYLNSFTGNLVYNPTIARIEAEGITHPNKPLLKIENNFVATSDPGFIDCQNGDFGLKPGVDLKNLIPAFFNIPFNSIGNKK